MNLARRLAPILHSKTGGNWDINTDASLQSWLVSDNPDNILSGALLATLEDKSGKNRRGVIDGSTDYYANLVTYNSRKLYQRQEAAPQGRFVVSNAGAITNNIDGLTLAAVFKADLENVSEKTILMINTNTTSYVRASITIGVGGSNFVRAGGRRLDSDSYQSVGNLANIGTGLNLFVACFDYNNRKLTLSVNGSTFTKSDFQTQGKTSPTNSAKTSIASSCIGLFGELAIFNRAFEDGDRQDLEGYLAREWSLQNKLPASHPYYNEQ